MVIKNSSKHNRRLSCLPLALLLEVGLRAINNLLHNAEVVLASSASLSRERERLLVDSVTSCAGRSEELAREFVKVGQAAGELVKAATNGTLGAAVLVEEADEGTLVAATLVCDRSRCALREELDGREGLDTVLGRERLVIRRIYKNVHVKKGTSTSREWYEPASTFATTQSDSGRKVLATDRNRISSCVMVRGCNTDLSRKRASCSCSDRTTAP